MDKAMSISPLAGKPAPPAMLVTVPKLVAAYYTDVPDTSVPGQRVAFGTSGHRGSSFESSFNEWHVLAISQAILGYNRGRTSDLADGIVITPSHNPPDNGGFKYNPPNGGPADTHVTGWIQNRANALLEGALKDVKRMALAQARKAATTHAHDYLNAYVATSATSSTSTRSGVPASMWEWTRWAAPVCITGRRSPNATSST